MAYSASGTRVQPTTCVVEAEITASTEILRANSPTALSVVNKKTDGSGLSTVPIRHVSSPIKRSSAPPYSASPAMAKRACSAQDSARYSAEAEVLSAKPRSPRSSARKETPTAIRSESAPITRIDINAMNPGEECGVVVDMVIKSRCEAPEPYERMHKSAPQNGYPRLRDRGSSGCAQWEGYRAVPCW